MYIVILLSMFSDIHKFVYLLPCEKVITCEDLKITLKVMRKS